MDWDGLLLIAFGALIGWGAMLLHYSGVPIDCRVDCAPVFVEYPEYDLQPEDGPSEAVCIPNGEVVDD